MYVLVFSQLYKSNICRILLQWILKLLYLVQNYNKDLCQFKVNQKPDKFQKKSKNFKYLAPMVAKLQHLEFAYGQVDSSPGFIGFELLV